MAIDIRATVTCSLGTLISATVSDDYVQGSGLIRCKGSCEVSGIIAPAIGTAVTFSYTKNGVTRQLPRKLRVLSSFADPFRRTTKVELGCKLTYLQDLKEPINWEAVNDPQYAGNSEAYFNYSGLPINASSLMSFCLQKLGITAAQNPLQSKFSTGRFDLSPGYVQVLSDLLVSESYCGYLNTNEVLQVFTLNPTGGTGPVLSSSNIIDIGPIGVGQLPGDAVVVSYDTQVFSGNISITLDTPEVAPQQAAYVPPAWTSTETRNKNKVAISYTAANGTSQSKTYNNLSTSATTTDYATLVNEWLIPLEDSSGNKITVVKQRTTEEETGFVAVAGTVASQFLSIGLDFGNYIVSTQATETFSYDERGVEIYREVYQEGDVEHAVGAIPLTYAFDANNYYLPSGYSIPLSKTIVSSTVADNYKQVVVKRYVPWYQTIAGQQAIAESAKNLTTVSAVEEFFDYIVDDDSLYLIDVNTSIDLTAGSSQTIENPKQLFFDQAKTPLGVTGSTIQTADNSFKTSRLELAMGSPTGQRRVDFTLPYTPDDYYYVTASGGTYNHILYKSNAEAVANLYGRVQNKLLLGNRYGMNVQAAPEKLPTAPFAAVFVQAQNLTAMYRTNGSSWTMDSNGIVASSDLLFWGGVGKNS